jgi:hypothetical protein
VLATAACSGNKPWCEDAHGRAFPTTVIEIDDYIIRETHDRIFAPGGYSASLLRCGYDSLLIVVVYLVIAASFSDDSTGGGLDLDTGSVLGGWEDASRDGGATSSAASGLMGASAPAPAPAAAFDDEQGDSSAPVEPELDLSDVTGSSASAAIAAPGESD